MVPRLFGRKLRPWTVVVVVRAVEECSVRRLADLMLCRSQTHLEQQFAEHKRRLARLDQLRSQTDRMTSPRPGRAPAGCSTTRRPPHISHH